MKTEAAQTVCLFALTGALLSSCGEGDPEGTSDRSQVADAGVDDLGNVADSSDSLPDAMTETDVGGNDVDATDRPDGGFDAADGAGNDTGCVPSCAGRCAGPDGCDSTCPDSCISPQTCGGSGVSNVCGVDTSLRAIAAGAGHTCGITASSQLKCWGANTSGQLGDGTKEDRLNPIDVDGFATGILSISVGAIHSCALASDAAVSCWGANYFGQLGDGARVDKTVPTAVLGVSQGVLSIGSGASFHSCVVMNDDTVRCWGDNKYGQLGDGTTEGRPVPTAVVGLSESVLGVAVGGFHVCVLTTAGGVKCWGRNSAGQLGDGSFNDSPFPVAVAGMSELVVGITAGANHTCALTGSGLAKCWGTNQLCQLGIGSASGDKPTPVDVWGISDTAIRITAGWNHSCVVTAKGGLKCWGSNENGQLGDGTTDDGLAPVDVQDIGDGVFTAAAGADHTCALLDSGAVKCWGKNDRGQLGNGTKSDVPQSLPVDVVGFGG